VPEHIPVLLNEVIGLMRVRSRGTYLDATYGRGGHSRALLRRLDAHGRLFIIDRDPEAFEHARAFARSDSRVIAIRRPFSQLDEVFSELGSKIDGALFDLGMSTPQLDDPVRGFSFQHNGPLDMRMDPTTPVSAADWLMSATEQAISDVLWQYGEERRSRQIARKIVETRSQRPLKSTHDLAALVRSCMRDKRGRIDPATRTFQAVRIFINDELGEIERALEGALNLLDIGGRVLVIAFHSLEDRLVKRKFRDLDRLSRAEDTDSEALRFRVLTPKPLMAGAEEKAQNPRARSARLRALERYV
jgi:16S rRNA (cytosine1402-N4)-methyltransferase